MTIKDIYRKSKEILLKAGTISQGDRAFDVIALMENKLSISYNDIIINPDLIIDSDVANDFIECVKLRANGYPLQYILGEWEFDNIKFMVGDGVLIPREDTIVLVDEVSKYINKDSNMKVLDLCAGSGTISISLAKRFKNISVTAVELSQKAIFYLNKNIKLNCLDNIFIEQKDILKDFSTNITQFDIIVSNPPYIKSNEISYLQKEVLFEPLLALDGGNDGTSFYQAICEKWLDKLKPNGIIAFEIGEDQSNGVKNIMKRNNVFNVRTIKDINKLDRVLIGNV